ncbi:MAG: helix-turn-helix domain containing protein [Treponema sp.]|nr:helix-turn-helix domain containing protein [Treponema sp.]
MSITRKKFLIDCGLSHSAISTGLKRKDCPTAEVAYKCARVLDTTVEYLLTGQDPQGLAPDERNVLNSYRRLDDRDRQEVVGIIAVKLSRYEQSYEQGEKALA